jgi:hypothetical protein
MGIELDASGIGQYMGASVLTRAYGFRPICFANSDGVLNQAAPNRSLSAVFRWHLFPHF